MKKIVSMTMALLMVLVLLPTSALATDDLYTLSLHMVDLDDVNYYTYNGDVAVKVGVDVEANSFLRGKQELLLAVDLETFTLLDRESGRDESGRAVAKALEIEYVPEAFVKAPNCKLYSKYADFANSKVAVPLDVAVALSKDEKMAFVSIGIDQDSRNFSLQDEKEIVSLYLGFANGYVKDIPAKSVRLATRAEADSVGHVCPVVSLQGGGNFGKYLTKGGYDDTNNITVTSSRHCILPYLDDPVWCSKGAAFYWTLYENGTERGNFKDSSCELAITDMESWQQQNGYIRGHIWSGEVQYQWSEDFKSCTAVRSCVRDESHTETAFSESVKPVVKEEPTCAKIGKKVYTAHFTEGWADDPEKATIEVDIPVDPKAHDWGDVQYRWSQNNITPTDYLTCVAFRVCKNNDEHVEEAVAENEKIEVIVGDKVPAYDGKECFQEVTYIATFDEVWAGEKQITVREKLRHNHGDITYTWSEDFKSCTASGYCYGEDDPGRTLRLSNIPPHEPHQLKAVTYDVDKKVLKKSTCTKGGKIQYTATFTEEDEWAITQVMVVDTPALGHAWGEPEYFWSRSGENFYCTAVHKCTVKKCSGKETAKVLATREYVKPTNHEYGYAVYVADFEEDWAETQLLAETADILVMNWDCEPYTLTYTWTENGDHCVAERVSVENPDITDSAVAFRIEKVPAKAATCEVSGETTCTAYFDVDWAKPNTITIKNIPALEHAWAPTTYTWAKDGSSCVAERRCLNDPSHNQTAVGVITSEVTKPATPVEKGQTTYTATFAEDWTKTQYFTIENVRYSDMDKWTLTYTWAEDGSSCMAMRVYNDDPSRVQKVYAKVVPTVTKAATCEEMGETTYTATFTAPWAPVNTKIVKDIPALGHRWGDVKYTWANDGSYCVAERVCLNDPSHKQTLNATIASEITKQPTADEPGEVTYTATFAEDWAKQQLLTLAKVDVQPAGLPGDVTGDGVVDNLDAALILKLDAGLVAATELINLNGDVTGDGVVDNMDAAKILKFDAGLIFEF